MGPLLRNNRLPAASNPTAHELHLGNHEKMLNSTSPTRSSPSAGLCGASAVMIKTRQNMSPGGLADKPGLLWRANRSLVEQECRCDAKAEHANRGCCVRQRTDGLNLVVLQSSHLLIAKTYTAFKPDTQSLGISTAAAIMPERHPLLVGSYQVASPTRRQRIGCR